MLKATLKKAAVDEFWKVLCLIALAAALSTLLSPLVRGSSGTGSAWQMVFVLVAALANLLLIGQLYFGNVETNAILDEHGARAADGGLLCVLGAVLIGNSASLGLGMYQAHIYLLLTAQALNVAWLGWSVARSTHRVEEMGREGRASSELRVAVSHLTFWLINNVLWLAVSLSACGLVSFVISDDPARMFLIQYRVVVVLLTINRLIDVQWNARVYERAAFRSINSG